MNQLPLINLFEQPIAITKDINHRKIVNPIEAASHIAKEGLTSNFLANEIEERLNNCSLFKQWLKKMPSRIPKPLSLYQHNICRSNIQDINDALKKIGVTLSPGQYLFHGGFWNFGKSLITDKPLSTTFCPQVAYLETLQKGKAYDAGRIDLWVLKVTVPITNVYVYKQKGTKLGHEKEVLFNTGAKLKFISEKYICHIQAKKIQQGSSRILCKDVPIYILEINIS